MNPEASIERRGGLRFKYAAAIAAGSIVLAACVDTNAPLEKESSDAEVRTETVFCFAEEPNCTPGRALAVLGVGNQIPAITSPKMCDAPHLVDETVPTDIDPDVIWAFLSQEDGDFCKNNGVDWSSIARAVLATMSGNRQGGSNTNMQLARNLFVDSKPDNNYSRKLWEMEQAFALEREYTKTELIQLYFNNVYFGRGAYGIVAAAEVYFGKPASNLSQLEAALLVRMLQNPGKYEGGNTVAKEAQAESARIEGRKEVLQNMVEYHRLSQAQVNKWLEDNPTSGVIPYRWFAAENDFTVANRLNARFALDMIMHDAQEITGLSHSELSQGLTINTTIRRSDQLAMERAFAANPLPEGRQFGAIMYDNTGGITAYIPGVYAENGPNIDLMQNPVLGGSQDKIYFVVTLLENGYTKDTIVSDPPTFDWPNYDGRGLTYTVTDGDRCPADTCTLFESIARSSNGGILVEVKKMEEAGVPVIDQTFELMDRLGIPSDSNVRAAAVLGGRETAPVNRGLGMLELVGRQGLTVETRMINSIVMPDGSSLVYRAPAYEHVVDDPAVTTQLTEMLLGSTAFGTASHAFGELASQTQIAAKTGTGEDNLVAGISGVACLNGENRTFSVVERYPDRLAPMDAGTDGGGPTARLAADFIRPLIGQPCEIIPVATAQLAAAPASSVPSA